MKKMLKMILGSGLGVILAIAMIPAATFANSTNSSEPIFNIEAELIKNDNDSVGTFSTNSTNGNADGEVKEVNRTSHEQNSDGSITESFEVKVSLPSGSSSNLITTMDSKGGSKTEAFATANLDITYYLRNNNEEIKIAGISGSWEPNSYIRVTNREVFLTDGSPLNMGNELRRYPSSNSFSYGTGWGWGYYYPGTDYSGAAGWSKATLKPSGMGGSHNLFLQVTL